MMEANEPKKKPVKKQNPKSIREQTLYVIGLGTVKFIKDQELTDDQLKIIKNSGVKIDQYFK